MHGKEAALRPPMEALGFKVHVAAGLDTDRFGTFSGEVERAGDMLEAARAKARAAFTLTGGAADWVVASEGAFGSSRAVPFLTDARELLLAWRPSDDLEVVETRVSFETNFAADDLPEGGDPSAFLERIGFPEHAVIVRAGEAVLAKAVTERAALDALIARQAVRLETDMRAHLNPTRMGEIAKAGEALARRLASPCPACAAPGFGLSRVERGLPCAACGTPTDLVRAEVHACPACGHEADRPRSDGRAEAEPGECPVCNP
jgi:predicted RNA-binding Zn-ribbon protein involved in translation (DUF1610 family)